MRVYVPCIHANHEGFGELLIYTPTVMGLVSITDDLDPKKVFLISNVMKKTGRLNVVIHKREYSSNSGLHAIEFTFKPCMTTKYYDFYSFRLIFEKSYLRARFPSIEEIAGFTCRVFEDEITSNLKGARRIGYIATRVSRGFDSIWIVEPRDTLLILSDRDLVMTELLGPAYLEEVMEDYT